jgi:hypothetical protein
VCSSSVEWKRFEFKVSYEKNYEIYFKKVPSRCARDRQKENTKRGFSIRFKLNPAQAP